MNETSLLFLYQSEPFYALCIPDLINAPKPRIHQFLREQRNLTESLKRIERCHLSRISQLNEEKRQFALLMRRKFPQRDSHLPCLEGKEYRFCSIKDFPSLSTAKSSGQICGTLSLASNCRTGQAGSLASTSIQWHNSRSHVKEPQHVFVTVPPTESYQREQTPNPMVRSERCFSAQQSENISKNISRATYRVK